MKKIVVVGAGFAGWATALSINKLFPWSEITVIGSKEIGILGAGEGTIPSIEEFLQTIEVDPLDLIKNCKATIKYGIVFNGWDKNGSGSYMNPFRSHTASDRAHSHLNLKIDFKPLFCHLTDQNIDDYTLIGSYARNNKVFYDKNTLERTQSKFVDNAYHFDAIETAEFLKQVAISRNIKYVDDIVTHFLQKENGDIYKIITKHQEFDCDFVFDCSGFKRLIIGQLYKTKYISVQDKLPVNRALPFFLPPRKETEPYTIATAMNYGWCWQIPLQHRYGCGYVFDSTLCDDETAKNEIKQKFGDVNVPRVFSFNAGYYEEFWKNNCIAIGLSNSFLEPLEATSIWTTTSILTFLRYFIVTMHKQDQEIIDTFNEKMRDTLSHIVDHLQFHYLNKRSDTEFWIKVNNGPISPQMQENIKLWKYVMPDSINEKTFLNSIVGFNQVNWMAVGLGINFFDRNMIQNAYDALSPYYSEILQNYKKRKLPIQKETSSAMTHDEFIKRIVGEEQYKINRKLIFQ